MRQASPGVYSRSADITNRRDIVPIYPPILLGHSWIYVLIHVYFVLCVSLVPSRDKPRGCGFFTGTRVHVKPRAIASMSLKYMSRSGRRAARPLMSSDMFLVKVSINGIATQFLFLLCKKNIALEH